MKAIKIIDNKLNWVDADYPVCMDHEVIIKIKSTAVNRADLAQKAGLYPAPPGASEILGLECSGIIHEVGRNVVNRQVGDEVIALLAGFVLLLDSYFYLNTSALCFLSTL